MQHDQAKKSWVDPENMNYTSISTASVTCGSVSYLSIPISETISPELRVVSIFRIAVAALSCSFVILLNNHFVVLNAERSHATKHSFAHESIVTEVRITVASGLAWAVAIIPLVEDFWPGNIQNVTKLVALFMQFICLMLVVYLNVSIYREVRRKEKQIIANCVSVEVKEKLLKNIRKLFTVQLLYCSVFYSAISRTKLVLSL